MATRQELDSIVRGRLGGFLSLVANLLGADSVSTEHAIAWAVRRSGGATASIVGASDTEIESVSNDQLLVDLVEYRLLDTLRGNFTAVSGRIGPLQEDYNDLSKRLDNLLSQRIAAIMTEHGIDLGSGTEGAQPVRMAGVVAL